MSKRQMAPKLQPSTVCSSSWDTAFHRPWQRTLRAIAWGGFDSIAFYFFCETEGTLLFMPQVLICELGCCLSFKVLTPSPCKVFYISHMSRFLSFIQCENKPFVSGFCWSLVESLRRLQPEASLQVPEWFEEWTGSGKTKTGAMGGEER